MLRLIWTLARRIRAARFSLVTNSGETPQSDISGVSGVIARYSGLLLRDALVVTHERVIDQADNYKPRQIDDARELFGNFTPQTRPPFGVPANG